MTRTSQLLVYHMGVYCRALHPDLFSIRQRRTTSKGDLQLESWILDGGHLLRFQRGQFCCCELVVDHTHGLPSGGMVHTFACTADHEYEHRFFNQGVNYITTASVESLSGASYSSAVAENAEMCARPSAASVSWRDAAGTCLSVIDVTARKDEVHVECAHLLAEPGLCVRTLSIFELFRL